jgi:hypothetical protein
MDLIQAETCKEVEMPVAAGNKMVARWISVLSTLPVPYKCISYGQRRLMLVLYNVLHRGNRAVYDVEILGTGRTNATRLLLVHYFAYL